MVYEVRTRGVCAQAVRFEVEDNIVQKVDFIGGCSGNTQGVAALCIGRKPEELIPLMEHINCGGKGTSCPAQLAIALKQAVGK